MNEPALARRGALVKLFAAACTAVTAPAAITACGGEDDELPTITLAAVPLSGREGATIALAADAEDNEGIESVSFYRIVGTATVLLATFTGGPFLFQTILPTGTAGTTVQYFARVTDTNNETVESTRVSITVTS